MLNKLILLPSMIFIILLLCSCESFEAQKTFARRILDNPDSAISIYKNSEFYNDSLCKEYGLLRIYLDPQSLEYYKTLLNNNKYKLYKTEKEHNLYKLVYRFNDPEYYIKFFFEKIDNKWYLITMPNGKTYYINPLEGDIPFAGERNSK